MSKLIDYGLYCRLESRPRGSSLHSHTETPSSMSSVSEIDEMMNNVDLLDRFNVSYMRSVSGIDELCRSAGQI